MSFLTMAPPMLSDLPSSTPTSIVTSSAQQTNASQSPSKVPSTSSLLFGFLISFLALFIVSELVPLTLEGGGNRSSNTGHEQIFMGCGLGSRYMVDRRRQRAASGSNALHTEMLRNCKPALWDVRATPGHEKWEDMMPLSAKVRRHSTTPPPVSPDRSERNPAEQLLHLYHGFGRGGRFSFSPPPHRTQSRISVSSTSRASRSRRTDEAVDLQIAVLVAMPSLASRTRDRSSMMKGKDASLEGQPEERTQDEGDIHGVALGVATIPWDKERMDFG